MHPHHAELVSQESCKKLTELSTSNHVVAMGEMGFRFFFVILTLKTFKKVLFEMQLQLAAYNQKPVFLHQRDSHHRFYPILKQWRDDISNAVVHCFTDNRKALFDYLDLGCSIGITGWVCDERRGLELQQLIKHIPKDRIMIETDAPYLIPRNIKQVQKDIKGSSQLTIKPLGNRNEPAFLPYVIKKIAQSYGTTDNDVIVNSTTNAKRFFNI